MQIFDHHAYVDLQPTFLTLYIGRFFPTHITNTHVQYNPLYQGFVITLVQVRARTARIIHIYLNASLDHSDCSSAEDFVILHVGL